MPRVNLAAAAAYRRTSFANPGVNPMRLRDDVIIDTSMGEHDDMLGDKNPVTVEEVEDDEARLV